VQLWKWRQVLTEEGYAPTGKKIAMKGMAFVLAHPTIYRVAGKMGRWVMQVFPFVTNNKSFNPWYKQREMPAPPKQSFRDWYIKNKK
jgi:L-lactate dehydrogenase complex protein LldF